MDALFTLTKKVTKETLVSSKKETALELPKKVMALAEDVICRFETREPLDTPLACQEGCTFCCHYQVIMTPPEVLLIGSHVKHGYRGRPKKDLFERIERYKALREGKSLDETASVLHDTPCIFLKNDRCSIYKMRPLVCRAWHSHNSSICKKHFRSATANPDVDGYNHRHYVYKTVADGMAAGIAEMGLQSGAYTIAGALMAYFSRDEPEKAWLQGEPVFSGNLRHT